jgi:hypothetical protein
LVNDIFDTCGLKTLFFGITVSIRIIDCNDPLFTKEHK